MAEISLIISVYNRPDALALILLACEGQSFPDFEIIVADDGSGPGIAGVLEQADLKRFRAVRHVRHDDLGWRKNRILNSAVRMADSDYLVFIDGDCVPHHRFLEDHWKERAPRVLLCGRRVELSEDWTRAFTPELVRSGRYQRIGLKGWVDAARGRALRVEDGIRFPLRLIPRLLHMKDRGMLGSNFSLHRSDLWEVNGFDEEYEGPGCGEDSDLQYRLQLSGVNCRPLRHRAIQYHLWHPRTEPARSCIQRLREVRRRAEPRCRIGLADSTGEASTHRVSLPAIDAREIGIRKSN
jgi:glycosyltransferase involved in cell wall biosynthesis